ncbi:hypothetical protein LTR94_032369, partial [Friedmanniomyces endolithicus]
MVHLQVESRDCQSPSQSGHYSNAAGLIDEARQYAGCESLVLVRQLPTPTDPQRAEAIADRDQLQAQPVAP